MSYTVTREAINPRTRLVIVGCGGTGSFAAEGLCRLLINVDIPLLLIDHDRVEERNLLRQNFFAGDVGKFKSQALAERLARQYGRRIGYSILTYELDNLNEQMGGGMYSQAMNIFLIGCVDNPFARLQLANSLTGIRENWWLDAGNSYQSGQVLFGNVTRKEDLEESFDPIYNKVTKLPAPSLQLPSLLMPQNEPARQPDCAEAVATEEQSPVINQAMATLVVEFIHRLLKGTLSWMGAYINLEAGTLQTVPADPTALSRMFGMKVNRLIGNKCELGSRYHIGAR